MTEGDRDPMPAAVRQGADDPRPLPDADALFAQLQTRMAEQPKRARVADLSTPRRLALSLVVLAGIALLSTRSLTAASAPLNLLACALYVAAGLGLILATLRPLQRPNLSPAGLWVRFGLAIVAVTGLAMLPALVGQGGPATPLRAAFVCLGLGTAYALPMFWALRWLDRGQRVGRWTAAVGAGVIGNLALQLHCPSNDMTHRLLGHALVVGALAIAAGLAIVRPRKHPTR